MKISIDPRAVAFTTLALAGCGTGAYDDLGLETWAAAEDAIVDVPHTAVERQSVGNCWLYAEASWAESMHQVATGDDFDTSQSFWTYMHWFEQVTSSYGMYGDEISTGGSWWVARRIVLRYGLMRELDFVPADSNQETSFRQANAMSAINDALSSGVLATAEARRDRVLVRSVMDDAWDLAQPVRDDLDQAFGPGLNRTFLGSANASGTNIIHPDDFPVAYTNNGIPTQGKSLLDAVNEWRTVSYPSYASSRRRVMRRMQTALHDRQPVIISWLVDFNALEYGDNERKGSFNLQTLEEKGGPGGQGGHMTVLEDYEAVVTGPGALHEHSAAVLRNQWKHYGPYTLESAGSASIEMAGTNDADLYVRMGAQPTDRAYDCRPYRNGSRENCSARGPGQLYVSVKGYAADSAFSLAVQLPGERILLAADVTLDPNDPNDRAKLQAALASDTEMRFLRVKNSWGANRQGLPFAPGPHDGGTGEWARGYHDLYMDFLDGPIANENNCSPSSCPRTLVPLWNFVLPPGY